MPFLIARALAFELRLDQRDDRAGVRASVPTAGSTSLSEMKLTSMVARSGGSASRDGSSLRMSVCSRETISRRARRRWCKLAGADIDRVDALGAARQQHLGEAAGRGADIEADTAGDIEMRNGRALPQA